MFVGHRRSRPYDDRAPSEVIASGMPRRRNHRGLPRRPRTAKALRMSRHAVKSQCAHGWGGWGRLSDDDPRQQLGSERGAPGAEDSPSSKAAHDRAVDPTQSGTIDHLRGARKADTNRTPASVCREQSAGRCCPTCLALQPYRENPPYGMIGRAEEATPSFEARVAPRSRLYPTERFGG